ncbi:M64 family metallopeptidase [Motilibacter deserti]|uniref:Peptidase M64 n=1 Tax=Motilibacter deserti TaxID=2714956 RepID=A0ABX0H209_9ACTN|nr:M64 family metallopeptidase [Motilibacter deserti]NHC15854.1 peptidase M64 [Motilibacter deserti]
MKRRTRSIATLGATTMIAGLATAVVNVPGAALAADEVKVVPIQITGPASERMNLIILGDGYQADEMDKFRADVDRNQNVQWATEPFRSYRNYFNVYRVEIPSKDSGVRCDPDDRDNPNNNAKDTALRLWYSDGCTNPLSRGTTYGPAPLGSPAGTMNGNQARTYYLDTYVAPVLGIPAGSQNVQTLAVFNSYTYGGIGGTHATTSGGAPQGPLISLHELGHSLGTLADEYPYSSRDVVRPCYSGGEPASFHHTLYTDPQKMVQDQVKWWRWIGEESESGGTIGAYEGGNTYPCGVRRPSEHSQMRWIGFYLDQIGRENMTWRITGRRTANAMALSSTPQGQVGPEDVVWVETQHPRFHELTVTWRVNGAVVPDTHNTRNLDLGSLGVKAGDVVQVTVKDETEFVRDPFYKDGPRLTQTRQWTVGTPLPASTPAPEFTNSSYTDRQLAKDEVVYVETTHPTGHVLDVTWRLDDAVVPNPHNSRNFDLSTQSMTPGTHTLTATVTDPADPAATGQTLTWTVDNGLPVAPRELSEPLTTLPGATEHPVYFEEFDMGLAPSDDEPGFVVGEFRLNHDGWFNYFGFPDAPPGTPFKFSAYGSVVKALTYGNLGSGGLSKAAFEQTPEFGFVPGYGTHTIEHRAIDAAGNIGDAEEYSATVLPGSSPACDRTLTGTQTRLVVSTGVTCLDDVTVNDGLTVRPGASVVVHDGTINGGLTATGAQTVQLFGTTVYGPSSVSGTTSNVTVANVTFNGRQTFTDNASGDYGVALVGNTFNGGLACTGNTAKVNDFGAPNSLSGSKSGQCAALETTAVTTPFTELAALLAAANGDGTISDRVYAALTDRLMLAERQSDLGHEVSAIGYLHQFVARAENQVKGDAADLALRAQLVAKAQTAIAWLRERDAAES